MSNRDLLKNCLQKLEQMQNQMANQAILIQEQIRKFAVVLCSLTGPIGPFCRPWRPQDFFLFLRKELSDKIDEKNDQKIDEKIDEKMMKKFICDYPNCGRKYKYRHTMERHQVK